MQVLVWWFEIEQVPADDPVVTFVELHVSAPLVQPLPLAPSAEPPPRASYVEPLLLLFCVELLLPAASSAEPPPLFSFVVPPILYADVLAARSAVQVFYLQTRPASVSARSQAVAWQLGLKSPVAFCSPAILWSSRNDVATMLLTHCGVRG